MPCRSALSTMPGSMLRAIDPVSTQGLRCGGVAVTAASLTIPSGALSWSTTTMARAPASSARLTASARGVLAGTEMARLAPAHCGTCGFFLSLAGSLQAAFGVCGNEMALADGRVVSVEHGCGAHSEAVIEPMQRAEAVGTVYDDGDDIDPIA